MDSFPEIFSCTHYTPVFIFCKEKSKKIVHEGRLAKHIAWSTGCRRGTRQSSMRPRNSNAHSPQYTLCPLSAKSDESDTAPHKEHRQPAKKDLCFAQVLGNRTELFCYIASGTPIVNVFKPSSSTAPAAAAMARRTAANSGVGAANTGHSR